MPQERPQRLVVPDVLRGIAIVAMLIAHAIPFLPDAPGPMRFLMGNINDLASPLFALVMGMSAQLSWNSSTRTGRTILQQFIRGAVLVVLGLWMATWGSWVAIVLAYLGVLLIVGVPALLLRTRTLAVVAVIVVLVGDPVNALLRQQDWAYTSGPVVQTLADWFALGPSYRVTNLLPFFLLGGLLIRHGLARDKVLWAMLAIAPVAYLVRPVLERIAGVEFGSGSYPDTLHDVGLVFAVYALTVFACSVSGRGIQAICTPFRAWGQLALSLYLVHVGVIAVWRAGVDYPYQNEPLGWVLVVIAPLIAAWLWWRYVGTGPAEWGMSVLTGSPKRMLRRAQP